MHAADEPPPPRRRQRLGSPRLELARLTVAGDDEVTAVDHITSVALDELAIRA
jgi:hypothetical protein